MELDLFAFDRAVAAQGFPVVCGVDEAGRGPLAGPVYAAAVVLPYGMHIDGLDDSKKLTSRKRDALYEAITAQAVYAIASASVEEIDRLNILQASLLAMRRAVQALPQPPDLVLADGLYTPDTGLPSRALVKGDGKSACIAAASILAKVARDRCLVRLDAEYPEYVFAQHKGYPTKRHYELLDTYGPSPVHRRTFLKKWHAANPHATR